jgi:predicted dehydrogenase
MHRLLFLDPGHFHAALTLRVSSPRVAEEIVVYASGEGPELRDFLSLVERFNGRAVTPTRWRPIVVTGADPEARLIDERRGDVVVLAGRNGGKARTIQRLHAAGFHVLGDKPWLVEPADLEPIRASLSRWPLAMEVMTGRRDLFARVLKRLVDAPAAFGGFRTDGPAIEQESVHQLAKLVDGAPLRRPWWFFDVRVQGSGAVDIPTHLVDRAQWLADGTATEPGEALHLLAARAWSTPVPVEAFCRITGEAGFPPALRADVAGDTLSYRCNAEIGARLGAVTVQLTCRWDLASSPAAVDTHRTAVHGSRADLVLEQSAHTGHRRRLRVRGLDGDDLERALRATVAGWQAELPGVGVMPDGPGQFELTIPDSLDAGHESHFARVLDDFLTAIDDGQWPSALAARTLAKYTFLAEVAAKTGDERRPATPLAADPRR